MSQAARHSTSGSAAGSADRALFYIISVIGHYYYRPDNVPWPLTALSSLSLSRRPMRKFPFFLFFLLVVGQAYAQVLPHDDAVRVREFYRLAAQISDETWPGWSKTPAPLLLVTSETEFLTHHPHPPASFKKIGEDWYQRPRQFSTGLLATFPAFGPPSVIVIGDPSHTEAKTSTPWMITLMHEHFHQFQDAQPGAFDSVQKLGLAHGDTTGMWMLNYPFPYDKPTVVESFNDLRDLLLAALAERDGPKVQKMAKRYIKARKQFLASLSSDDARYLNFQIWKEGIARYVQVKSAEAAAHYTATPEYAALPDYESFADYATRARRDTIDELHRANLSQWKRTVVYSLGACEGFLLDRLHPAWRDEYFLHPFTLEAEFDK